MNPYLTSIFCAIVVIFTCSDNDGLVSGSTSQGNSDKQSENEIDATQGVTNAMLEQELNVLKTF